MRRKLGALAAVAAIVVAAGAFLTVRYWSRTICWAGHAPDRIAGYEQRVTVTAKLENLPPRDVSGAPALVLDLPAIGLCPSLETSGYLPMGIWVRVGDDQFVGYGRGGGP